jgi:hypothetical protein
MDFIASRLPQAQRTVILQPWSNASPMVGNHTPSCNENETRTSLSADRVLRCASHDRAIVEEKMERQANRIPTLFLSLGILCLSAAPSWSQDSVIAMCEMVVSPEHKSDCECTSTSVKDQISSDEFEIYANVGTLYLENMANGLDRSDAWDAAAKKIGDERGMSLREVLTITNPIGQMHAKIPPPATGETPVVPPHLLPEQPPQDD